jgi:hypothetical protein
MQGLFDARYRVLKTGALLILSLDVFFFFACYLAGSRSGEPVWQFNGFLNPQASPILPVLLKYMVLCLAIVSLPMALHGRKLALTIRNPADTSRSGARSSNESPPAYADAQVVEPAFSHYRRIHRAILGALSVVNLLAAAYFVVYGEFWLLALASSVGFFNKLAVFPGPRRFTRWMSKALEAARGPAAT